ncbi:JAB domain-containing protein [Solibacillus merdavium]|uniref:RadC-like JAB domain-containing protein n=1 Tax=Solibacillus merdavium TaxID=2762218 RepID=A0ABR8XM67_9BACL|nr:JAB domain-containing protein [Solibacillus merdavium]MBD8033032.1 hypothetical protein [Solibacillus merdavium]
MKPLIKEIETFKSNVRLADCQYPPVDIEVSRRLKDAGNYIGIEVLDSIIVSYDNEGLSLKEKGLM